MGSFFPISASTGKKFNATWAVGKKIRGHGLVRAALVVDVLMANPETEIHESG